MGSLSDIVNVAVSTLTTQVTQPGFGVPLIVDYHTRFAERIRYYAGTPDGLAAMLADTFTVNDAAYKAASKLIAQNPTVDRFAIGRRALAPDLQVDLFPTALNSTVYSVNVTDPAGVTETASFTSDATATVAEIVAGLVAAINALAGVVVATDIGAGTNVRCKAAVAGQWFSVTVNDTSRLTAKQTHVDPGIATDLAAIALENSDFYGVTMTTMGQAEIVAAAAWVETNKRFAIFGTQDTGVILATGGTVALTVKAANQYRSQVFYKHGGDQFQGAALLGSMLPKEPGAVTAWGRKLASQDTDALTETHLTNLKAANAGWFTSYGGVSITRDGKGAAGEYLDVIRDRDWLESRMQTDVFTALTNADKIPFTDRGASVVVGAVKSRLALAVDAGVLSDNPAPVVIAPKVSAVAPADKLARRLKPITFTGTLAGAIQAVNITGTVTV
jgi:hypothetical protein